MTTALTTALQRIQALESSLRTARSLGGRSTLRTGNDDRLARVAEQLDDAYLEYSRLAAVQPGAALQKETER